MSSSFSFFGSSRPRREALDPFGEEGADAGELMLGKPKVNPMRPKVWFFFDERGKMRTHEVDKYTLATRLLIPLRDMRVLDPMLFTPYPSAVFIREQSIILNLEHIKVICCADQVWLLDTSSSAEFSETASRSLSRLKRALSVSLKVREDPHYASCHNSFHDFEESIYQRLDDKERLGMGEEEIRSQLMSIDLKLPFELRATEAALNEFTSFLHEEVALRERESVRALQTLGRQVSRKSLENVRGMKTTLNGLISRVTKVREELERLLDDDEDMLNMCLGDPGDGTPDMMGNSPVVQTPATIPERSVDSININSPRFDHNFPSGAAKRRTWRRRMNHSKLTSIKSSVPYYEAKEIDVMEAVEAFLEVYFLKTDFLVKKLSALKEKIDNTEGLLRLELDHHRNKLIQIELLLTTGTLSIGTVAAVAGIFGMNLVNDSENSHTVFVLVTVLSCVGGVLVFFAIAAVFLRYRT
ncbi:magnesium transporter [Chloropicon primus]|uniref:Magnesium transporter n=2 Tax=Chloropicon primus TaxID=1764295 RepID=A0A5B8MI93_9CHLO|nr:magnesium transporter [Chloropicon primus]UPQ98995.1 magnesium transporter [Chloropicon primus]|eukprot:QDZ19784.1 magnesium transporter [Chloropicon primus]